MALACTIFGLPQKYTKHVLIIKYVTILEMYNSWQQDFESRYFTEDVPFGASIIQKYARSVEIEAPTLDFLTVFLSR